jgi:hypothetical protein
MKKLLNPFKFYCSLFIVLLFIVNTQYAQSTASSEDVFSGHWRITAAGGTSLFFGDVKQYRLLPLLENENELRFNANVLLEYQLSPVISLRGQVLYAHLAGTRRSWQTFFYSDLMEANLNTAINLSNIISGYRSDRFLNINVIGGIGLVNYNTTRKDLVTRAVQMKRGFGNGSGLGGRTLEGIVMGGIGLDFRLNDNISLRLETANRIMNSDLLDIHDNGFPYDVYNQTSLGLSYTFGKRMPKMPSLTPEQEVEAVTPMEVQPKQEPVSPKVSPYQAVVDAIESDQPKEAEPEPLPVETPVVVETTDPEPDPGLIEYRVQIRARINQPIAKSFLEKRYNIPASDIQEDMHNGYYIYTVGSYRTLEEAASNRNRIRRENGIGDAFIVAFQYGKRLNKLP